VIFDTQRYMICKMAMYVIDYPISFNVGKMKIEIENMK